MKNVKNMERSTVLPFRAETILSKSTGSILVKLKGSHIKTKGHLKEFNIGMTGSN